MLGTKVSIETIGETIYLHIPQGVESGEKVYIRMPINTIKERPRYFIANSELSFVSNSYHFLSSKIIL